MEKLEDILKQKGFPISSLIEEIADWQNIYDSFDYVVSHLETAQQREHMKPRREKYCRELHRLLSAGEFRIGPNDFRTMLVTDGPKDREVQAPTVFHRGGCHSIMDPFEFHSYSTLIENTAASIKHRGMHWLHEIIEEYLAEDPDKTLYYYKCDIYHYYDSINQEIMKQQVRQYTSDPVVLPMLDNFIELLPKGLSKGLRASQCFANIHLNEIDHEMTRIVPYHIGKDGKKKYHYFRYCDDIVIIGDNKKELWKLRDILVSLLATLGLQVKPDEAVRPLRSGLDYLGYKTYTDDSKSKRAVYSYIRKRTKQKFARRLKRVKSRRRRRELIGSFFGMAAHGDCRNLLRKLITQKEFNRLKHKRKMKEFGNFNVKPTSFNGKKNFKGNKVSCAELDHKGVIIVDYEIDVVARRDNDEYQRQLQIASSQGVDPALVPKPKTKTIISLIYDGKMRKLWTGDKEILDILQQIDKADGFPFFVAIEIDYTGTHKKINFVPAAKFGIPVPTDQYMNDILAMNNIKL